MERCLRFSCRFTAALATLCLSLALISGCHQHLTPPPVSCRRPPEESCPENGCDASTSRPQAPADWPAEPQLIDLPSALQLADRQNPEIAVARERINEALAVERRADALWLPNLEYGPLWMRHDGQIQRSTGEVITVSRSSLFIGGGWGLSLDISEAIFAPLAARQFTLAREAGAAGVAHGRLLDVALAYIDLLQIHALIQVSVETLQHAQHLQKITEDYEKFGKGAKADTARARTEAAIRDREELELQGQVAVSSARLVQLLQLPAEMVLRPVEPALVPIALIPEQTPLAELLVQALTNRPELAENRALINASLERWRAAKIAPLVPRLQLGYAAG